VVYTQDDRGRFEEVTYGPNDDVVRMNMRDITPFEEHETYYATVISFTKKPPSVTSQQTNTSSGGTPKRPPKRKRGP
jgi:hypothetical protein